MATVGIEAQHPVLHAGLGDNPAVHDAQFMNQCVRVDVIKPVPSWDLRCLMLEDRGKI